MQNKVLELCNARASNLLQLEVLRSVFTSDRNKENIISMEFLSPKYLNQDWRK
jgi:hypothetical protein